MTIDMSEAVAIAIAASIAVLAVLAFVFGSMIVANGKR